MARLARLTSSTTLLLFALGAPTSAQSPSDLKISLSTKHTATATSLTLKAQGTAPELAGAAPASLALVAQKGFLTDPLKAVVGRCTAAAATATTGCPANSKVGHGSATATASGVLLGGTQDLAVPIDVYLADKPVQPGDAAGLRMVATVPMLGKQAIDGRILKPKGNAGPTVEIDGMDKLFGQAQSLGITVTLKQFSFTAGAKRSIKQGKKKTTYALLTTPKKCTGKWSATLTLTKTDGTKASRKLTTACKKP